MSLFNSIKLTKPKKNVFDLTHDVKMSGKMGNLMPTMVVECVPGDVMTCGSDIFMRFAPLQAPIMHRVDAYVHTFFVPSRILWENWEKFITNQDTGGFPQITINDALTADQQRLLDYMGVPPVPNGGNAANINALPFAAYQCIYNEYYRDQNLVPEVNYQLTDGINPTGTFLDIRKRSYEHDYFTASLPFAQKGGAVDIPLGEITLNQDWLSDGQAPKMNDGFGIAGDGDVVQGGGEVRMSNGGPNPAAYDPDGTLEVQPTTINDLRRAMRLQEWLERNARGGTRYIENILAHFGVRSSDKRLQRPEYITGTKTPVTISEVLNTASIDGELPQGNMAGKGVSYGSGAYKSYRVEEHGYIISIMSVMPKPAYQQGIPKWFLKNDPLQFYWPSFAHIGEQEVQNQELYAYTNNAEETFGYIPRYAEYKYMPNRVAGDFRTTLDFWHLGRIFATEPTLSQEFLEVSEEDVERIFAVEGEDNLYCEVLNKVKAVRPMPVFGTPML